MTKELKFRISLEDPVEIYKILKEKIKQCKDKPKQVDRFVSIACNLYFFGLKLNLKKLYRITGRSELRDIYIRDQIITVQKLKIVKFIEKQMDDSEEMKPMRTLLDMDKILLSAGSF